MRDNDEREFAQRLKASTKAYLSQKEQKEKEKEKEKERAQSLEREQQRKRLQGLNIDLDPSTQQERAIGGELSSRDEIMEERLPAPAGGIRLARRLGARVQESKEEEKVVAKGVELDVFNERAPPSVMPPAPWEPGSPMTRRVRVYEISTLPQTYLPPTELALNKLMVTPVNELNNPEYTTRFLEQGGCLPDRWIQAALRLKWNNEKPLRVVLDLDSTMFNALETFRLPHALNQQLRDGTHPPGLFPAKFYLEGKVLGTSTKFPQTLAMFIRPGMYEFITKIRKFCKLYLFTHGRKEYADAVLRGSHSRHLFESVMASQTDADRAVKKSLDRLGFTEKQKELTVIIDDQILAWDNAHKYHLCPEAMIVSARYLAQPLRSADELRFCIPEAPTDLYSESHNYHLETTTSTQSQLHHLGMLLEKIFVVATLEPNKKAKDIIHGIQIKIFPRTKFYIGFISLTTRQFFKSIVFEVGGKLASSEADAGYTLTDDVTISRLSPLRFIGKAYCKNMLLQCYLLKTRVPSQSFKTQLV